MRNIIRSVNCQELSSRKTKPKVAARAQFDLSRLFAFQSTSHHM